MKAKGTEYLLANTASFGRRKKDQLTLDEAKHGPFHSICMFWLCWTMQKESTT